MADNAQWYVVHTYSGYENKVKANLEKTIENNNLHHIFYDINVPMEEVVEYKDDQKKTSMKKLLPGYIIVKMIMTDFSWYIVRNTRGVTGFVGPGSKPVPLTEEELAKIQEVKNQLGSNFCRRCNYCAPCTVGINIPSVFLFQGYLDRYGLGDWAKDRYSSMAVKASACIECGACETRCPYNLPIRKMLKDAAAKFGE